MILKNFVTLIPTTIMAVILKRPKETINENIANYIEENGLYHFTTNYDKAELIKKSGVIYSSGRFNSYGEPVSFFFSGIPDIETYTKNMTQNAFDNLLLHPEKVLYALKLNINKNQLANYKIRVQDGVILHEGDTILRDDQVEIKQLVLDLIKDRNGNKRLGLRERTEEEKAKDNNIWYFNGKQIPVPNTIFRRNYPSQECLDAIREEKKRLGYILDGKVLANTATIANNLDIERRKSLEASKAIIKKFWNRIKQNKVQAINENPNKRIKRILMDIQYGRIDTKRSVRDKKYSNNIMELNKQGKIQRSSIEIMDSLHNNRYYQCSSIKEKTLDHRDVPKSKIHGINHSRRTAILTSVIMQDLGMNFDEKVVDILITAAYKHDIGRILDTGSHAKRCARKLNNEELEFIDGKKYSQEDKKLLCFLVEGHELPDKKTDKLLNKYGILEHEQRDQYKIYLNIIKDADALDRARLSRKTYIDLNPKYLRLEPSKRLIDFSFDLEKVSTTVKDNSIMFYEPEYQQEQKNTFMEELKMKANEKPGEPENEKKIATIEKKESENELNI